MNGKEELDVSTVFKCRMCGVYLIPPLELDNHKEKCQRLKYLNPDAEQDSISKTYTSSDDKALEQLTLPRPVLLIQKLSVSSIENFRTELRVHENVIVPLSAGTGTRTTREAKPRISRLKAKRKLLEDISVTDGSRESDWQEDGQEIVEDEDEILDDGDEIVEDEVEYKSRKKRSRISRTQHKRKEAGEYDDNVVADVYYNYKCTVCQTKFRSESDFNWHMENIHGSKSKIAAEILTCPICGRMLNKRLCFQSHLKRHENAEATEEAFDLWNKWPERTSTTKRPKRKRTKNCNYKSHRAVFNCKYCLIPHDSHHSFITHMNTEHPDKGKHYNFCCTYSCSVILNSMKHLIMHLRNDHTEEYYGKTTKWGHSSTPKQEGRPKGKCDICGRMLDVWYLKDHKERMHSKGKKYSAHPNERPKTNGTETNVKFTQSSYKCPLKDCSAQFKNSALLKTHFILHLENNPFACKVPGCGVKCDAQCHLDRHMKLHTGKPLICSKCGVSYSRIDKLRNHVCTFDPKKLRQGPDGLLLPVNSNLRLKRVREQTTHDETQETPTHQLANESSRQERVAEKCNANTEIKIETSENPVFLESNSGEHFDSLDRDQVGGKEPDLNIGDTKINRKKRHNMNAIILSDPVFHQACQESPNFGAIIFGNRYPGFKNNTFIRSTMKSKSFKCHDCGTNFNRQSGLLSHKLRCKGEDVPAKTNKEVGDGEDEKHFAISGVPSCSSKIGCVICGESFLNTDLLKNHLDVDHEEEEIFQCGDCKEIFASEHSRRRHFLKFHASRPFKCSKCDSAFMTKNRLDVHVKLHRQNPEIRKSKRPVCTDCNYELATIQSLRRHMFLIHGIKTPVTNANPKQSKKIQHKKTVRRKGRKVKKSPRKRDTPVSDVQEDYCINIKTEPELMIEDDSNVDDLEPVEFSDTIKHEVTYYDDFEYTNC